MDKNKILNIAEKLLEGSELFVVDLSISPSNQIELLIDSDSSVGIDSCIELSRSIEAEFDREVEDFELTVASAGIGRPLKVRRQYQKLIGKSVELVLKSGIKMTAELKEVSDEGLTVSYTEKVLLEGKKRKTEVEKEQSIDFEQIKYTIEVLDFK